MQRCFIVFRICDRARNLAHFGLHTGRRDDCLRAPVCNAAAHIEHIFPVAEGNLVTRQRGAVLVRRHALSGQRGFLRLQRGALQNAAVRRNIVAGFQRDDVTGNEFGTRHDNQLAGTVNLAQCGAHRLQCCNRGFRLVLLIDTEHRIRDDHKQNNKDIRFESVSGDDARDCRNRCCGNQHENHRILELLQHFLQQRRLRGLIKPVAAVGFQPFRRFRSRQTVRVAFQLLQNGVCRFQIMLHLHFLRNSGQPVTGS